MILNIDIIPLMDISALRFNMAMKGDLLIADTAKGYKGKIHESYLRIFPRLLLQF